MSSEWDECSALRPPTPSRRRFWARAVAVSLLLHAAFVAIMVVGAFHSGSLSVERRSAAESLAVAQVTLVSPPAPVSDHAGAAPDAGSHALAAEPPAPDRTATASSAAPAAQTPAVGEQPATAPPGAAAVAADGASSGSDYRRRLQEHIAARRRAPPPGTAPGTVYVRFSLARDGDLVSAAVAVSSGDPVLDRAAIDAIRGAAPMPAVPAGFTAPLSVMLPIDYRAAGLATVATSP